MSETLLAAEVYDRLQQAMASDPDGLCELYRDFLSDARESLSAMRAAFARTEPDTFRQKAHYLKSSTMVLGMRRLAETCGALEEMGKRQDLLGAGAELKQAERLLDAVEGELSRRLGPGVLPNASA